MKASFVAQVITDVYNNGHVKSGGQKLEYDDFLQMVFMAKAKLLDDRITAAQQTGQMPNLEDLLIRETVQIQTDAITKETFVQLQYDPISLPDNLGVFNVVPLYPQGAAQCQPLVRMPSGSEWLFCGDTGGMAAFVVYPDRITLKNLDSCIKTLQVLYAANSEDSEVPDAMAYDVARSIWNTVFRTITIPVDKIDDQNPNPDEIFKTKLSSPQRT